MAFSDETDRQFIASQVEYLVRNEDSQRLVLSCGIRLLEQIGPSILLTHSQAGPFGWLLTDAMPEKVKGIVALEPSGPPFSADLSNPMPKNYGIADLPLRYDPPVGSKEEIELELLPSAGEGLSSGWVMKKPARQLPNLQEKPIFLIVSEASYHAGYDHLTSYVLRQSGVEHEFIRLEEHGFRGNGHMIMLEKNNLEIADFIVKKLEEKGL